MFVSMIKYSKKCSSFYVLIMSQDNTYKICLLIKLDVRDQEQNNNAVSVIVTCCRNPFKIEQLRMAFIANWTPEKHLAKIEVLLLNHVSFGLLIESLKLVFFHRRFEVCKCLHPD